jgi:hypothetical protein
VWWEWKLFDNADEDDDKSINKIINVRGRDATLEEVFVWKVTNFLLPFVWGSQGSTDEIILLVDAMKVN